MKNIFILLILTFFTLGSAAQITLENTYQGSASLTNLTVSGNKYFLMDATNRQCILYNMDHSIWKTISLAVPANTYLYDIKLVSDKLFNSDDNVELAYICYSYDTTLYYYTYYLNIVDETGNNLLSLPGCGYLELKTTTGKSSKMMAYIYDFSVYPSTVSTAVYSLPGSLPSEAVSEMNRDNTAAPFPNPAKSTITIPYRLPDGVNRAEINVINNLGSQVAKYNVDRTFDHLMVPVSAYPKGLYFYQVKNGNEIISSGKFIHD